MGPTEQRTAVVVRRLTHSTNEHSVELGAAAIRQARRCDAVDDGWQRQRLGAILNALRHCGPSPGLLDDLSARVWSRHTGEAT